MDATLNTFTELADIFMLNGTVKSFSVISNGNINTTYDVTVTSEGTDRRYVFQKLNIFVFKNPKKIMQKIR